MVITVAKHFQSADPRVRLAALTAGLALGHPEAWPSTVEWAEGDAVDPELFTLVALLGQRADHEILFHRLQSAKHPEPLLWTLGACGSVEAGDLCLEFLRKKAPERMTKAAAESMSWIGGFDLQEDEFQGEASEPSEEETLPALEEDDLDADLGLDGFDDLPTPHSEAIAAWWVKNRDRLSQHRRHLFGQPASREAILKALESAPLWRRPSVALELCLRTGGAQRIPTHLFSRQQRGPLSQAATTSWNF
jgi:uncharacterized protein (TIGR02270 family)